MARNKPLKLTVSEQVQVRELDANLGRLKVALGDLALEEAALLEKKKMVMKSIKRAEKSFIERIGLIARVHGINPNADPSKGTYTFDVASMIFSKKS